MPRRRGCGPQGEIKELALTCVRSRTQDASQSGTGGPLTPLLAPAEGSAENYISNSEHAQIAAGRLIYSNSCGLFYASLLVASLTEIVWILHPWVDPVHCCHIAYPKSPLFFLVEAYLTIGLLADVALRFVWQRESFWLQHSNIFDVIVCGLSLLSFMLYWRHTGKDLEVVVLLIMFGWLIVRIARLVATLQKIRDRHRSTSRELDVAFPDDFDDLTDEEQPSPRHSQSVALRIPKELV